MTKSLPELLCSSSRNDRIEGFNSLGDVMENASILTPELAVAAVSGLKQALQDNDDEMTDHIVAMLRGCVNLTPAFAETLCNTMFPSLLHDLLRNPQQPPSRKHLVQLLCNNCAAHFATHTKLTFLVEAVITEYKQTSNIEFKGAMTTFFNLLAYNEESRDELRKHDAVSMLLESLEGNDERLWPTDAALAIANLVGHEEAHPALDAASGHVMQMLSDCLVQTLKGLPYPPNSNEFYTDWKLMLGISNLCKSDTNKLALLERGILPTIVSALNPTEVSNQPAKLRTNTLRALWHLTFLQEAAKQIASDTDAVKLLESMELSDSFDLKARSGILWNIRPQDHAEKTKAAAPTGKGHVMLSYCWANQQTVLRIHEFLKTNGINTWIDVVEMSGSTLEAMASAVENCSVFVCAISSDYKQSAACRLEGEYAFSKRKKIVPVMVEQNFSPDGWLGALIGSKLWIDFTNPAAMHDPNEHLLRELQKATGESTPAAKPVTKELAKPNSRLVTSASKETVDKFSAMTAADVCEWLRERNLEDCVSSFQAHKIDGRGFVVLGAFCQSASNLQDWLGVMEKWGIVAGDGLALRYELITALSQ